MTLDGTHALKRHVAKIGIGDPGIWITVAHHVERIESVKSETDRLFTESMKVLEH